jgi:NADH-quinone oxidoreductase subunit L
LNKYYVDEIYSLIVIKPFLKLSEIFFLFDKYIIDGAVNGLRHLTVGLSHLSFAFDKYVVDGVGVNGTAYTLQWFSKKNIKIQTGEVEHYALGFFVGFVVILVWYLFL